ncbi:hypothetical protein GCM10022254_51490 [Actinomadura meridiana]|uniref:Tyr recombinase domain-containing protein n=1 Tax=Actinomadura meridiana TaxID=559626 RepID=A0ABP8CD88_9ACTN
MDVLCGGATRRGAETCWTPIATGLTPHGLRHSHRTMLEDLGIAPVLIDDRMGHKDGSVQRRYTHVTARMRQRLARKLTEEWEESLRARYRMYPESLVTALNTLLDAHAQAKNSLIIP